jgi:predicted nucleic acid-binding protein
MLAVDTNVIVRYLTGDHPIQSAQARALIDREDVFVCTTVLLETEWVLRSVFDYTTGQIVSALHAFAGLPRVTIEAPRLTAQALEWTVSGMDFADALHLASTAKCDGFVSFDRRFARTANRLGTVKVQVPS